jgi:hypothetical protein
VLLAWTLTGDNRNDVTQLLERGQTGQLQIPVGRKR